MQHDFDQVLDECLNRVLQRREPLEGCLADFPGYADQLRPLLQAALDTEKALSFTPDADRKRDARLRFQDALEARAQRASRPLWRRLVARPPRWAMATAAALLLIVGGGAGAVAASTSTVPGDPLYPVKRATEQVQMAFTFGRENKAELYARLADRRANEVAIVARQGRHRFIPGLTRSLEHHLQKVRDFSGVVPAALASGPPTPLTPVPATVSPSPTPRETPAITAVPVSRATPEDPRLRHLYGLVEQSFRRQESLFAEIVNQLPPEVRPLLRQNLESMMREYQVSLVALRRPLPANPSAVKVEARLLNFAPATALVAVLTDDGRTLTLGITHDTRITINGEPSQPQQLLQGDRLRLTYLPGKLAVLEMDVRR